MRRDLVTNGSNIFVNQRRIDERIIPGQMARNPIAYHSSELAQLQREAAVRPRRDAEGIFVEPNLGALVAGIKPTIQPRLRKEIDL